MPWSDVLACLKSGEGSQVEFLPSVLAADDLLKYCVAFLNESGGKIVVGIDDKNSHLLGSNISKHFVETALQKITPPANIVIEEIPRGDRMVLLINIPEGKEKPYATRNKFYMRNTSGEVKKIAKDMIRPMVGAETTLKWNARQTAVLHYLKTHDAITNRDFRDQHGVSHKTAHIELTALLIAKLINKVGQGRNTAYQLANIV
jgi:ATP-dependent DNA helicase RecG